MTLIQSQKLFQPIPVSVHVGMIQLLIPVQHSILVVKQAELFVAGKKRVIQFLNHVILDYLLQIKTV